MRVMLVSDMYKCNYLIIEKGMTKTEGGKMWIHWEMTFDGWTTKHKREFISTMAGG